MPSVCVHTTRRASTRRENAASFLAILIVDANTVRRWKGGEVCAMYVTLDIGEGRPGATVQ